MLKRAAYGGKGGSGPCLGFGPGVGMRVGVDSRAPDGRLQARRQRGLTMVELMVTLVLLSLLLGLAAPSFRLWINNAKVRTATDALQSGLRLAQAEAIRRNRQVVFFLTNDSACTTAIAANANGSFWGVRSVALVAGEATEAVQCGVLPDSVGGVAISGPTAVCFNSMGRQVENTNPGVTSASCALSGTGVSVYNVSAPMADRPLRVVVTLGGQTRMCDPARSLSSTQTDGCS